MTKLFCSVVGNCQSFFCPYKWLVYIPVCIVSYDRIWMVFSILS